jgi:hypothetical protein
MPSFKFKSPEGKTYTVNGPEGATQEQAFQMLQQQLGAQTAPAAPEMGVADYAADAATGFGAGLAGGTAQALGAMGDVRGLASKGVDYVADKVGVNPETAKNVLTSAIPAPLKALVNAAPTSEQLLASADPLIDPSFQPKTTLGEYAKTTGQMAPGMAMPGGGGGIVGRALTNVIAPAVTSETAGQLTKGTAAEPYMRLGGAVVGGAVAGRLAQVRRAAPDLQVPDVEDAKATGKGYFNSPEVKNLLLDPAGPNALGARISQRLEQAGFFPETHAAPFAGVNRLATTRAPVSFDYIESVRRNLGEMARETAEGKPTANAKAASMAVDEINDYISNGMGSTPANVVRGDPIRAAAALRRGQAEYGPASRSERAATSIQNAADSASTANSGTNAGNRTRQELFKYLKNDGARARGNNDAEMAALSEAVKGTFERNAGRQVANWMGGSGVSAPVVGMIGSMATGSPLGFAIPAAGLALKHVVNRSDINAAKRYADLLLERAPSVARAKAANRAIRASNAANENKATLSGGARALATALITKKRDDREKEARR